MKRTIWTYWVLTFLYRFSMSFVMPVYVLFLLGRGLNLFQINLVNMIFYISLFITEIPTGAYADVFGRRKSCLLSCFLFGAGLLVYINSSSVWGFALAESLVGTGATFANGAYQAWLVDRLKYFGHSIDLKGIFSKTQSLQQVGVMVGSICGGFLAQHSLMLPWMVATGFMAINLVLIFFLMKEEYFKPQKLSVKQSFAATYMAVSKGIRLSSKNSAIKFVLFMGFVQLFAVQAPNMQWQPYFGKFFHSKTADGFLFAGMSLCIGIGSLCAPVLTKRIKDEKKAIAFTQGAIGICLMASVVILKLPLVLAAFLLHEVGRGVYLPVRDAYLNDHVSSAERATLLSCASVSNHIGGIIGLLVSGFLAQFFSIKVAWIVAGGALFLSSLR